MATPMVIASRITWMDAVRGTAILLLLIWHASAVPELYGVEMPGIIRTVNEFFMPYRMPTLMLLSGILLAKSLDKPTAKYYAGKFSMILWPYILWVIIAKATFLDIEGMPWWHWRAWYATSYLWFLFFIGVYYLIAPAFTRLPPWLPSVLAVVIGILLPAGTTEQRMAYFAVFFFGGYWLAKYPAKLAAIINSRIIFLAAVPVASLGLASCFWPEQLHFAVWTAPASIAGMLLLAAAFSRLTSRGHGAPVLQAFGRSSLIYYVSHFPLMALISMSAAPAHLDPLLLAILNLTAALGMGWFFASNKKRIPVRWLFEAPRTITRLIERSVSLVFRQKVA